MNLREVSILEADRPKKLGRVTTYLVHVIVVVGSLLISSNKHVRIFGALVGAVLAVTYLFFSYAYITVFCFGGALMSLYLVWVIFGSAAAAWTQSLRGLLIERRWPFKISAN